MYGELQVSSPRAMTETTSSAIRKLTQSRTRDDGPNSCRMAHSPSLQGLVNRIDPRRVIYALRWPCQWTWRLKPGPPAVLPGNPEGREVAVRPGPHAPRGRQLDRVALVHRQRERHAKAGTRLQRIRGAAVDRGAGAPVVVSVGGHPGA